MEKGTKTSKRKKEEIFSSWVENEKDDRPLMLTRDLNSFLDNRSDASLVEAADGGIEVDIQMEKLKVKDHELEWLDEDDESFMGQFTSDFASSLRRESLLPKEQDNRMAKCHNELTKQLNDKHDALVVKTTRMLNASEKVKTHLRNTVKSLTSELAETRENWQTTAEADNEEISSLQAKVKELNAKIEKFESKNEDIEVVNQKCRKCNMVVKYGKSLQTHMKEAHGIKLGKKCTQCPEVLATGAIWRQHIKDHLMDKQFYCEICKKTFQRLEEAQSHTTKPCGPIKAKGVVIDIEDSEEGHTCNACFQN
jgi:uncharacterized C2H2 Zn-finger protein